MVYLLFKLPHKVDGPKAMNYASLTSDKRVRNKALWFLSIKLQISRARKIKKRISTSFVQELTSMSSGGRNYSHLNERPVVVRRNNTELCSTVDKDKHRFTSTCGQTSH